jgi:predicted CoA-substrate-specific enzyme activase
VTTAGIDVGSVNTKVVFLESESGRVMHFCVAPTGLKPKIAGEAVFQQCLAATGLKPEAVGRVVATGYGRHAARFAQETVTEISAMARGVFRLFPDARTILDIGGQDSKVVRLEAGGRVKSFVMNDRCAAGTGHFLETMARALRVRVEDLGRLALESRNPVPVSSLCVVMVESEILSLVADDVPFADIVAGTHYALARRVVNMATGGAIVEPVVFCGGVARNEGMRVALSDALGMPVQVPEEPIIVAALGAALAKPGIRDRASGTGA